MFLIHRRRSREYFIPLNAGDDFSLIHTLVPRMKRLRMIKGPLAESGALRPITKPDADNFAKVIDALNGIVWPDDNQVVELTVEKFYSTRPRLEMNAEEIGAPFVRRFS